MSSMPDTLTNLLPRSRWHALLRDYHFRLGVVALSLCTTLVVVAAVFLLPTYIFLTGNVKTKEAHLADISAILSSSDEAALSARLATLTKETAMLSELEHVRSASNTIGLVLALPRPGVTLTSFVYVPAAAPKKQGTLTLSGTATTRDALRSYQLALQSAPFARSAELPVSAYAKDANIAFSIVVTFTP